MIARAIKGFGRAIDKAKYKQQLRKLPPQINLIANGVNYANWTITGTGTTKGADGIHLVNATSAETAKLTVLSLQPNSAYKLVISVTAVSTSGDVVQSTNLTGSYVAVTKTVGTQEIIISTRSDLTTKQLWFFISGGVGGDYIDFTIDALYELPNYGVSTTPKVLFTFDDGWATQYTRAFNYMQTKGIKGTAYVIPNIVGGTNYVTKGQLDEMHNAGWCLSNHTIDHSYMDSLDKTTAKDKIKRCMDWLNSNGYNGAKHVAYPGGQYNQAVLDACMELGILTGRTITEALNAQVIPELYTLTIVPAGGAYMTLSQIQTQITNTIAGGKTCILMFHRIVDTIGEVGTDGMNFLNADFQSLCDWLVAQGVSVMTIDEWYKSLTIKNPYI